MKSKLLLGALLMGAVVLPSCVDDTVSQGVEEIRKAKAEQLKSLAALNNAKAAAETTLATANAQLLAAQAELAKANAQTAAANAALIAAQTESEKIAAQAAAEEAALRKEEIKQEMALLEGNQKLAELKQQQELLEAENNLKEAILQADKDKADNMLAYLNDYTTANDNLKTARQQLFSLEQALVTAKNDTTPDLNRLQNAVKAQNTAVANAQKAVNAAQTKLDNLVAANGNIAAAKDNLAKAQKAADAAQAAYNQAASADATIAKTTNDAVQALKNSNYEVAVNGLVTAAGQISSQIGYPVSVAAPTVNITVNDVPAQGNVTTSLVQSLKVTLPAYGTQNAIVCNILTGKTVTNDSTVVITEGQPGTTMSYSTYELANASEAKIKQVSDSVQAYINRNQGAAQKTAQAGMDNAKAYISYLDAQITANTAAVAAAQSAKDAAQAAYNAAVAAGGSTSAQWTALQNANTALASANAALQTSKNDKNNYVNGSVYTQLQSDLTNANNALKAANKVLADFKAAAQTVVSQGATNTAMVKAINTGLTQNFNTTVSKFIASSNLQIANAEVAAFTAIIANDGNASTAIDNAKTALANAQTTLKNAQGAQAAAQKALDAYKGESAASQSNYANTVANLEEAVVAKKLEIKGIETQLEAYKKLLENAINAQ